MLAPAVIEVIAGIAASEVKGVMAMRGGFAVGVAERLGKKAHGKGIKVELTEEGVAIDVFVTVNADSRLPDVAKNIQQHIRQALQTMTALATKEINVHIVGIQLDQKADTVE
ncbi:Asp23/Gls24 family envelope stress response protein [Terribacillus saccharophilus]